MAAGVLTADPSRARRTAEVRGAARHGVAMTIGEAAANAVGMSVVGRVVRRAETVRVSTGRVAETGHDPDRGSRGGATGRRARSVGIPTAVVRIGAGPPAARELGARGRTIGAVRIAALLAGRSAIAGRSERIVAATGGQTKVTGVRIAPRGAPGHATTGAPRPGTGAAATPAGTGPAVPAGIGVTGRDSGLTRVRPGVAHRIDAAMAGARTVRRRTAEPTAVSVASRTPGAVSAVSAVAPAMSDGDRVMSGPARGTGGLDHATSAAAPAMSDGDRVTSEAAPGTRGVRLATTGVAPDLSGVGPARSVVVPVRSGGGHGMTGAVPTMSGAGRATSAVAPGTSGAVLGSSGVGRVTNGVGRGLLGGMRATTGAVRGAASTAIGAVREATPAHGTVLGMSGAGRGMSGAGRGTSGTIGVGSGGSSVLRGVPTPRRTRRCRMRWRRTSSTGTYGRSCGRCRS